MTQLKKHQVDTVEKASEILDEFGVVYIAGEMRIGKTLAALELIKKYAGDGKGLFVTPKTAIEDVKSSLSDVFEDCDKVVVINRESLHKVGSERFEVIVADESHRDGGFPKVPKSVKALLAIHKRNLKAKVIFLSGTPSLESAAQLFHQFYWSLKGPWVEFKTFYKWHKKYGIPKTIKIIGGLERVVYDDVREEVLEHVKKYYVTVTQEDAGFEYKPEVIVHRIENKGLIEWEKQFKKKGITEMMGRVVLAENPAAKLQKCHIAEGGTLIDEDDEAFIHNMQPNYKINYMCKKLESHKEYAIFTAHIEERDLIQNELYYRGFDVTNDFDVFNKKEAKIFIGSGVKYAEAIDLSWMTGSMIIYSLSWSGSKYVQLLERQNNMHRDRPIKVHVLCCARGVDELVYNAVSQKKNFNNTFYKNVKSSK